MAEPQNQQLSDEQRAEWVREQFQRANKHLAENGVLFDSVVASESRYLVPYVAVWKIKAQDNKRFWVMSGDLPADFTPEGNAPNAREAMKYFSMMWQMKAANLRASSPTDKAANELATLLETRAEGLYKIQSYDELWAAQEQV
jgi:hypothetical protein